MARPQPFLDNRVVWLRQLRHGAGRKSDERRSAQSDNQAFCPHSTPPTLSQDNLTLKFSQELTEVKATVSDAFTIENMKPT